MEEEEYQKEINEKADRISELEEELNSKEKEIEDFKTAFAQIQNELIYARNAIDDANRIIEKFI